MFGIVQWVPCQPGSQPQVASKRPHLVGVKDNAHITTQMPRSEFQYSWIDTTLGHKYGIRSGKQYIYGYQSRNGEEIVDINNDSFTVKPSIDLLDA